MHITFWGAAGEVTGSCSLLKIGTKKFLVDCGMFQGGEFNEAKNYNPLPFNAKEIEAVFITHAHLDHIGRLPVLIKNGFTGPIYATSATAKLIRLILEDAFEVMLYDHHKRNRPILFEGTDIALVDQQIHAINYYEVFNPLENKDVEVQFFDSGHIFGAAFISIKAEEKQVVFSGDVGNINVPILKNTDVLPVSIDALVCESTYGNRLHENASDRQTVLKQFISEGLNRGGTLMIPSFSLERTQELLYCLNDLVVRQHQFTSIPIFLDSPLAIDALEVYREYPEYYDAEAEALFKSGENLFEFPGLVVCRTREESKKINQIAGQKIIIAGSGMMNGGRILHHALRYLSDENSTLLLTGYQAEGTIGRQILDGQTTVQIFEEQVEVRCSVKFISTLSAHADQKKLLFWISASKVKQVYLNHGDMYAATALADRLQKETNISATLSEYGKTIDV